MAVCEADSGSLAMFTIACVVCERVSPYRILKCKRKADARNVEGVFVDDALFFVEVLRFSFLECSFGCGERAAGQVDVKRQHIVSAVLVARMLGNVNGYARC